MSDTPVDDRRAKGIAMMKEVYGWDTGEPKGRFVEMTVDHLFGEVWADSPLTVRERRLLLLGLLVGTGQDDVVGLQLDCALELDEFTADELRDLTILLSHYAGWPRGAKFNQMVEEKLARKPTT